MCGVAGIFSLTGAPVADAARRIERMTRMLHHRGPDGTGWHVTSDNLLALGTTRLAVTDPGAPIALPLLSETGTELLSFNGEIYDYKSWRARLQAKGVRFRHHTDTEVLLEALRTYGDSVLESMDGMWAFAHYSTATRRLLLSRDVMGERHLFYRVLDGELVFASEPGPILADRSRVEEFDFDAVATCIRYYSAPPGRTLVKGLRRMLPGHNIVATPGGALREYRYRRLHPEHWHDFFAAKPSAEQIMQAYDQLMQKVTDLRLPPDSPYVATLSGGIDSTIICAYASRQGSQRIPTLYAQSSDELPGGPGELNELDASRFTSRRLGTDHIEIRINNGDCVPVLRSVARNGFDGMIDPGVASFRMLAAEVRRRDRKVLIVSDGPDETAGGYHVDRTAYAWDRMERAAPARYRLLRLASSNRVGRAALRRLGHKDWIVPPERQDQPFQFVPHHSANGLATLQRLGPARWSAAGGLSYGREDPDYAAVTPELDASQRRALSYAAYSLSDMANLRTDKAFFAESVEAGVPFQAPELVDFLIALPAAERFGNGNETKAMLRREVALRVGPEIAGRRKYGFSAQLFDTPQVYSDLRIDESLNDTSLFRDLPFASGARQYVMAQRNPKLRWIFFALAETWGQMRTGTYDFASSAGAASSMVPTGTQ